VPETTGSIAQQIGFIGYEKVFLEMHCSYSMRNFKNKLGEINLFTQMYPRNNSKSSMP
jgi:hypothetical protein